MRFEVAAMRSSMLFQFLFWALAVSAPAADPKTANTSLWKEFVADPTSALLPDFSYSGYHHGEKAIPEIKGPVFNVVDYGAVPNNGKNASAAIQAAIDACEAAGGGVVFFPKGTFIINDDKMTTQPRIRVTQSRVVLRGSGSGIDGTILYSPAELQPRNPLQMWTGKAPIAITNPKTISPKTARVTSKASRGSMELTLGAGHRFEPGERVVLRLNPKMESNASFIAPHPWDPQWSSGISIHEIHEITAVSGNLVHLAEPLMLGVDNGTDWWVEQTHLLSEVGVEFIRFRGNWKQKFVHHRSWLDDSGWRGLEIDGCENSWVRNCVFEDMNWPLLIRHSRQISVENLELTGTPGHMGMQVIGTYGVLALRVRDLAGHHHGPSVQSAACCTVYHRCSWASDTSFDSHANNPYATLHDLNEGGLELSGVGGSQFNFPHHLHALVLWNLNVLQMPKQPVSFWTMGKEHYPKTFAQVLIAGVHGVPLEFDESTVCRNESPGREVLPKSLWLAQLERRLNKIPDHFRSYEF